MRIPERVSESLTLFYSPVCMSTAMKFGFLLFFFLFLGTHCLIGQPFYFSTLTSEQGLAHNSVFNITQDYKGFMWFGTRDGISRYDSHQIKNYSFGVYNPDTEGNRVNRLYASGRDLWVGTATGLFRYDMGQDRFVPVPIRKEPLYVTEIQRVSSGDLWVGSRDGIYVFQQKGGIRQLLPGRHVHAICEFRRGTFLVIDGTKPLLINAEGEVIFRPAVEQTEPINTLANRHFPIFRDRRGSIFMGANQGLLQFDEQTMTFRRAEWFTKLTQGRVRVIRTMNEDLAGNLWVGGESGIVVVDKARQSVEWYDPSLTTSRHRLNDRAIYTSHIGHDGTVWLGTYFGGVNYARPVGVPFRHLFPATDRRSIAGKAVSVLTQDGQGRLWVGSEDAGLTIRNEQTGRYTVLDRSTGMSDDNIHALLVEKSGVAWVGTLLGGLNRIDPISDQTTSPTIRVYAHKLADSTSLTNNSIYALCRDRANRIWVGTVAGIDLFDERTGHFRRFRPDVLGNLFIYDILEDTAGFVWIATRSDGVYRYDPVTDRLTHYNAKNTPSIRNNQTTSIYEDAAHNLWFGSIDGGVCLWNRKRDQFVATPVNQYLPNKTVYGILEDNRGRFWFSTNQGLMAFDPKTGAHYLFDKTSGLQVVQFNFKSFLKDRNGHLHFGTVDGLCSFDPDVIRGHVFDAPVHFTDLKLFNQEVNVGSESVLKTHLDDTAELEFAHSENVITLGFVAINYFSKRTNYYTYYLEGFEKTWGPKTTVNTSTYTNLSPGTYIFRVRAYRSDGTLSPNERAIRLVVRPPFWQSTWAYLLYGLLFVGALWLYRRFITFLNEQKMAVEMERAEREKSTELNRQKLNFFTFLSNEFKTPITLIRAEIDELMQTNQNGKIASVADYSLIQKNARRLEILIDQITELRKTDSEHGKIQLTNADVVAFVKETLRGFEPLLQSRHLRKHLTFSHPYLMVSFDTGKLEMIIENVVFFFVNALSEGNELYLDVQADNLLDATNCPLTLTFSAHQESELFTALESSYRAASNSESLFSQSTPTGIGILLTISLVKMLSGTVQVFEEGERTGLTIKLPLRRNLTSRIVQEPNQVSPLQAQLIDLPDAWTPENGQPTELMPVEGDSDKPVLLIADRSKDLTQFLRRHYGETYQISVAHSFAEVARKAQTALPDLILCENELRDKEGQNVCTALKANPLTSVIPVLLLLNDHEEKTIISGLKSGADGYLSKPFNLNELDLLIDNHLKAVAQLKNKVASGFADTLLTNLPRRNKEQAFIARFTSLVNQEYKNKDVTTDWLAEQMNCSRSQLHSKVKTLTGHSTKEYLNDYRLTLARQHLANGMSVAEVAFEVGFGDPNYFGRAFRKKFGISPSRWSAEVVA